MTVAIPVHGIPSGSLPPRLRLTESPIAQSEASDPAERVRGGTGKQLKFILLHFVLSPRLKALDLFEKCTSVIW